MIHRTISTRVTNIFGDAEGWSICPARLPRERQPVLCDAINRQGCRLAPGQGISQHVWRQERQRNEATHIALLNAFRLRNIPEGRGLAGYHLLQPAMCAGDGFQKRKIGLGRTDGLAMAGMDKSGNAAAADRANRNGQNHTSTLLDQRLAIIEPVLNLRSKIRSIVMQFRRSSQTVGQQICIKAQADGLWSDLDPPQKLQQGVRR